jgi:hypothetical protein
MRIDWLNYEYTKGRGSEANEGALKAMQYLVTDKSKNLEDKYIQGHLLNNHLGGEGDAKNMYPITGWANNRHYHSTEKKIVKDWLEQTKTKPLWIWYEVKVKETANAFDKNKKKSKANWIDAEYQCYAILKDEDGEQKDTFLTTIISKHNDKQRAEAQKFELGKNN